MHYSELMEFVGKVLGRCGLDEYSRDAVTTGLCESSLRGVDSHGVRLLPHYVDSALSGRKNPQPRFRFSVTFPSIGHLDADNAFGHAAGMRAIEHGMEMAKEQGIGAVAVSESSHPGALASMALKAARAGYAAFAFTHADSLLLTFNGRRPYFGTNPICFAVPRGDAEPYCLDMSSSIIPWNRLLMHREGNLPLPTGVAADESGSMTTDAGEAVSLLPLGTYKGYGIASMVEILCGIYTGMAFGRSIPSMYRAPLSQPRRLGQFYVVMRVDGVLDQSQFLARMQQMTDEVRSEPPLAGTSVLLPGDKEIQEAEKRLKDGIPLDADTLRGLEGLSARFGVGLRLISSEDVPSKDAD